MKFLKLRKDGGPHSRVHGFFFIEIKSLFSIVLLRFADGSRDAYHSHAFNAISWVLKGRLVEHERYKDFLDFSIYKPSLKPIRTPRSMFHKVMSHGTTWALTFRGPWSSEWKEYLPAEDRYITLTHGRSEVTSPDDVSPVVKNGVVKDSEMSRIAA